jgi:hypothetical protein
MAKRYDQGGGRGGKGGRRDGGREGWSSTWWVPYCAVCSTFYLLYCTWEKGGEEKESRERAREREREREREKQRKESWIQTPDRDSSDNSGLWTLDSGPSTVCSTVLVRSKENQSKRERREYASTQRTYLPTYLPTYPTHVRTTHAPTHHTARILRTCH